MANIDWSKVKLTEDMAEYVYEKYKDTFGSWSCMIRASFHRSYIHIVFIVTTEG